MTITDKIYKSIREWSDFFINDSPDWKREVASAKNYISTPDLKHWTYGKSAGIDSEYHENGGTAKKWLKSMGFVNVLDFPEGAYKQQVIKAFLAWAKNVECFDIVAKFKKDQKAGKRFELLIHQSQLEKKLQVILNTKDNTQQSFDEGFRTEIVKEVVVRKQQLIDLAKNKYGTKCTACNFDFGNMYGSHGEGFIEVHHLFPISKGKRKTKVEDLRPVCANCHRMLHRGVALLSIEELKEIINKK